MACANLSIAPYIGLECSGNGLCVNGSCVCNQHWDNGNEWIGVGDQACLTNSTARLVGLYGSLLVNGILVIVSLVCLITMRPLRIAGASKLVQKSSKDAEVIIVLALGIAMSACTRESVPKSIHSI